MRPCIYGRHQADAYLEVAGGRLDGAAANVCYHHLNQWLDGADDDPTMEPTVLTFINAPVGAHRSYWAWWSYGGPGDGFRYGWAPAWTPA
jgi:hypothetical protein